MASYKYIFGPVPSRRLGRSLGVDIIPSKLCTYDCIYCEVGKTDKRGLARKEYYPTHEIVAEVKRAVAEFTDLDHITLSGSGEPTLHSGIGNIIRSIKEFTMIPIAVLTNGSLLPLPEVRQSLLEADVVSPSLDAVSEDVFQRIDRPHPKIHIAEVIEGIRLFRKEYKGKLWLEILFAQGVNDSDNELQKFKEVIESIQPDMIHLNTIVRPPAYPTAQPVSEERLQAIQKFFGDKAVIISTFSGTTHHQNTLPTVDTILSALERRPMTIEDLAQALHAPVDGLSVVLHHLVATKKLSMTSFNNEVFYRKRQIC
ncbi:MAG: radical SAM protein [Bacteroidetes bacterium]|nr:radical SAM protein [Bacteroidota bacterium]